MHTRRIRRAQECAQVLRVFDAVEQQQQRLLPACLRRRDDLLDGDVGDGRGIGENALMAHPLGDCGIKLCPSDHIHCDAVRPRKIAQFSHGPSVCSVRQQDTVDTAPRLDRLHDGMSSRKQVRGQLCGRLPCMLLGTYLCTLFHTFAGAFFDALLAALCSLPHGISPVIRAGCTARATARPRRGGRASVPSSRGFPTARPVL